MASRSPAARRSITTALALPSQLSAAFGMFGLLGVVSMLAGCPSPEVEGRYDGFTDKTQDIRDEAASVKMDVAGTLADVTGTFHFSLTATPVAPTTPFQFIATTVFTADAAGGGQLDIALQPLSLEILATNTPREFTGDPVLLSFAVDEAGTFDADIGVINLIGDANPVTGSDIVATMQLQGAIQDENIYCGNVGGMVTVPANIDLTGSTFAAIRINPEDAMSPELLPDPPVGECPEGGSTSDTDGDSGGDTDSATGG